MKTRPELTILVGLPGSGKSTWAREHKHSNYLHISSDAIRKDLYGDENIQGNSNTVFEHMHNRTKQALYNGMSVIYDATNVTRKNRKSIIDIGKQCKAKISCIVIWSPISVCIDRDSHRERSVGKDVINKFLYRWQTPNWDEGFELVKIEYGSFQDPSIFNAQDYGKELCKQLHIPHDNPHHTFNVYEHSMRVKKYVRNNVPEDIEKVVSDCLLLAAMFHDVGKPYTKTFKTHDDGTTYAHYYQHNNVGGYMILGLFANSDNNYTAVTTSWLVTNHMEPYFESNYYKNLKPCYKKWIDLIHAGDISAH